MQKTYGAYTKLPSFYAKAGYAEYSVGMAELCPYMLERFDVNPKTVLDLACGEGSFAVAMARKGCEVTALDSSQEMVRLAREHAEQSSLSVKVVQGDLRTLDFRDRFDLVTCWGDALNHLLTMAALRRSLQGICRALKPDGFFLFDINTIYGLAFSHWQRSAVRFDTDDLVVLQYLDDYDYGKNIATVRVVLFTRDGSHWDRSDESIAERAYTIGKIRRCIADSGLTELACWANPRAGLGPSRESARLWFVTKRNGRNSLRDGTTPRRHSMRRPPRAS